MGADPEQPDASRDPAVVRVTTSGVRGRPSARPPGNRSILIAVTAVVATLAVGGFALRKDLPQTALSTPGVGAVGATDDAATEATPPEPPATDLTTTEPEGTVGDTPATTVQPTEQPAVETPKPTKKPPRPTHTPYVDPTDSWHTDWTPPPGFHGTLTTSDYCTHANGTTEVWVQADYHSPVNINRVEWFLDGYPFSNNGPGDPRDDTIIVGTDLDPGTTHSLELRFFTGEFKVDWVGSLYSQPFKVGQGPACPGG
jgi:hypothetical protein